jgi:hypothetical protein
MPATLGIDGRVNETPGITVELKIMLQVAYFIQQFVSFLAYGGSSFVKTELNICGGWLDLKLR